MTSIFRYIGNLLQLLISPAKGWEDIGAATFPPARVASRGYYPLTAITGLSMLVGVAYDHYLTFPLALMQAVVVTATFFISYFIAAMLWAIGARWFAAPPDTLLRKGEILILHSLGLLELIVIIGACLPVSLSLLQFLPAVIPVIIWTGARYIGVRQGATTRYLVYTSASVLLTPYLVYTLFKLAL